MRPIQEIVDSLSQRDSLFDSVELKNNLGKRLLSGFITDDAHLRNQRKIDASFKNFMAHSESTKLGDRIKIRWSRHEEGRWMSRPNVLHLHDFLKVFQAEPGHYLVNGCWMRAELDFVFQMARVSKELIQAKDMFMELAQRTGMERSSAKMGAYRMIYQVYASTPEVQAVSKALPEVVDYCTRIARQTAFGGARTPMGSEVHAHGREFGTAKFVQHSVTEIFDRWLEELELDVAIMAPAETLFQVPEGISEDKLKSKASAAMTRVLGSIEGLPSGFQVRTELEWKDGGIRHEEVIRKP